MDPRLLAYFLAVLRNRTLAGAARELGLSQSGLSKGLKRLEQQAGAELLLRDKRGFSPTEAGQILADRAQGILARVERARRDVASAGRPGHTVVSIGCGPTAAARLLPHAAALLRTSLPTLRLKVMFGLNGSLMPWLREGQIDLVLSSVPVTASDPAFEHESLYLGTMVVVARADHPLVGARRLTASDLAAYPWCISGRNEIERRALDELFLAQGLKPPEAAIETTSTTLMKSVVTWSDHLSFLPKELVSLEERTGHLAFLPIKSRGWKRTYGISSRRGYAPTAPMLSVMDAIREAARTLYGPAGPPSR